MGELFDTLERFSDAAVSGEWDRLRDLYSPDVEAWSPFYDVKGVDAFIDVGRAQNGPYAEIRQGQRLIAEMDNTVVTEWTWSVPHPGDDDRWFTLQGLSYFVFEDGRVTKTRQYFDLAGFLAVFSPPAAARHG